VLQFRSIISIVRAPANTGRARIRRTTVIKTDQINKGIFSVGIPSRRAFAIVVVKLIAPIKDETPARCRDKIVRSTAGPACATLFESGG
jgi:hypothetical protein